MSPFMVSAMDTVITNKNKILNLFAFRVSGGSDVVQPSEKLDISSLSRPELVKIRKWFAIFDTDRNGRLSWGEFTYLVRNQSFEEI